MATLPRDLEYTTVETMVVGERRWAAPSVMHVEPDRSLWLYGFSEVSAEQDTARSMCIQLKTDGYHVWSDPHHTYKIPDEGAGEITRRRLLPVQELHPGPHPFWKGKSR